jgi:hypothetical protein
MPGGSRGGEKAISFDLSTVNRILGVAVILVLVLVGFEVWANVQRIRAGFAGTADLQPDTEIDGQPTQSPESGEGKGQELPELDDMLNSFADKPMLQIYEPVQPGSGTEDEDDDGERPSPRGRFENYARKNLNLVALSTLPTGGREAMVVDKKGGKTYFLQPGKTAMIGEWDVEVSTIQSDRMVLKHRNREVVVQ